MRMSYKNIDYKDVFSDLNTKQEAQVLNSVNFDNPFLSFKNDLFLIWSYSAAIAIVLSIPFIFLKLHFDKKIKEIYKKQEDDFKNRKAQKIVKILLGR